MKKSVDIIIPTYRPDGEVKKLIERLLKQTVPPGHIFIMNTEKKFWNENLENLSKKIQVEHLKKEDFDHGGTRNRGIRKSEADYVICMTQDAMPDDQHLLERLLKAFEQEGVAAAYARQLPRKDCGLLERRGRDFNYPDKSCIKTKEDLPNLGIKTYFCSNVCAAYDRKIYEKQGGFIQHTIFNEDMIYAAGLISSGYSIAYVADAKVIHSHNYSGLRQLHRNFDLAVSQADHPEIFEDVPSEGEGLRLVKNTASYLFGHAPWFLPKLIWQSGMKYIGYRLGKSWKKLPKSWVLYLSDNKSYWK